jgi:tRNA (guanine37-N1)-methyltransferase
MKISILTLFPEMFDGPFKYSIIKKAADRKLISVKFINIRDFGIGKHRMVDDTPYGGGNGMIFRVDVLKNAIESSKDKTLTGKQQRIILLSAHGRTFNQKTALKFSELKHLIIVCGHYEGFDERVRKYVDDEISIGDYILTGGEIPAMLITDSVSRLVEGVIKKGSLENESFSPYLEYPQYTKPRIFENNPVPKILLSGNHQEIEKWKKAKSLEQTVKLRPDLIKND